MAAAGLNFEFVVLGPANNGFSRETRTRIRSQAMKAVAATRRRAGPYSKIGVQQDHPGKDQPQLTVSARKGPRMASSRSTVRQSRGKLSSKARKVHNTLITPTPDSADSETSITELVTSGGSPRYIPRPVPVSGLARIQAGVQVEVMDLSALTSVHVGFASSRLLTRTAGSLNRLLSCRHSSYFEHVYSRYGVSSCLDDAVSCLLLKAKTLLVPTQRTCESLVLVSYGKALQSLQSAVNDKDRWSDPDVLCATEMLAFFDLLHSPSVEAWASHMSGAARLMELRGPTSFTNDYEKELFIAFVGPLCCEAFRTNQACFLEQDAWQDVLASCTTPHDTFAERGPLAIDIHLILVRLPGFARRVTDIVCGIDGESSSPTKLSHVVQEARELRRELHRWRNRFDRALLLAGFQQSSTTQNVPVSDHRFELMGTSMVLTAIVTRLLNSVSGSDRDLLEDECESTATEVQELEKSVMNTNYRASFYLGQKIAFARTIAETSNLWRQTSKHGQGTDGRIEKWKFERWCGMLSRKTVVEE